MAWTTGQVTQNGNTTATFGITGSALSNHDVVVVGPTAGNSGLRINSVTVRRNPNRYDVSVTVVGAQAMSFRFHAEQID